MIRERCDFCRAKLDPTIAHHCVDEYAARLAVLQDQVNEFHAANKEYTEAEEKTPEMFARVCQAVDDLPDTVGPVKAKFYQRRAELASKVADAAAAMYLGGDDTLLNELSVAWIEFRYTWDKPADPSAPLTGLIKEAKEFLEKHKLTGKVERRRRPELLQIIEMLRDRLNSMTDLAHELTAGLLREAEEKEKEDAKDLP